MTAITWRGIELAESHDFGVLRGTIGGVDVSVWRSVPSFRARIGSATGTGDTAEAALDAALVEAVSAARTGVVAAQQWLDELLKVEATQ